MKTRDLLLVLGSSSLTTAALMSMGFGQPNLSDQRINAAATLRRAAIEEAKAYPPIVCGIPENGSVLVIHTQGSGWVINTDGLATPVHTRNTDADFDLRSGWYLVRDAKISGSAAP